jgi:hypothetical protein
MAQPPKAAPSPAPARAREAPPAIAGEDYDARMHQAITERVTRPVQAKPALDGGYGDLIAAARTPVGPAPAPIQRMCAECAEEEKKSS